jgi:NADH:ubiquinone oxidoreductase subunit 3 (subunit A)
MYKNIAIVFLVLWVIGFTSSYNLGGLIHILLFIAVVLFLVQLIQGRKL